MKAAVCQKCEHHQGGVCARNGKPISKIAGCSKSPGGKLFFRSRSGAEAFRVKVIGKGYRS